jgi:hypothetical protein
MERRNDHGASKAKSLPATGFAPDQVTDLNNFTQGGYAATNGVTIEIPSLGVKMPVVCAIPEWGMERLLAGGTGRVAGRHGFPLLEWE